MTLINDLDKSLRKVTWQNKKVKIKAKYWQDKKENRGFTLPNLILYYQASALTWIKDWCVLTNFSTLKPEGHGLPSGWHHYLWLEQRSPHFFKSQFLKNSLLNIWLKLRPLIYSQILSWVSPLEAVANPLNINEKPPDYLMLLEKDGILKSLSTT